MFSSIAGAAVVAAAALWWASRRRRRLALAAEPLLPHLGARVVGASAAALAALPAGDPAWAELARLLRARALLVLKADPAACMSKNIIDADDQLLTGARGRA